MKKELPDEEFQRLYEQTVMTEKRVRLLSLNLNKKIDVLLILFIILGLYFIICIV